MITAPALLARLQRIASKPPRYIVSRAMQEAHGRVERYLAPGRGRRFTGATVATECGYPDIDTMWAALALRPHAAVDCDPSPLKALLPGEQERVVAEAEQCLRMQVDLLGSGPVDLAPKIDWQRDFKTGSVWPRGYCRSIEYNNLDRPSDVKVPWELSRMQWLMPVAQAYQLTGDERYAEFVRDIIADWINDNPYAYSVNWACTMDVALRAISWTYFFHAFRSSESWRVAGFRSQFLASLYAHGDFTSRHLEKSDVNGNHYTADACGLVFVGLFFGSGRGPDSWVKTGWAILLEEIALQIFADGVDFEASVPYHRLVQELFLFPAIYRQRVGLPVEEGYRERLIAMARFTAAYSRPDGSVPLWGDADDARTLPFRRQPINDHRYLIGMTGVAFDADDLRAYASGPLEEIAWLLGPRIARDLEYEPKRAMGSVAFADGGFYVMRSARNHVFIDCGPVGLSGRGGHGHNDLLSFEAMLSNTHLITDCGAYLYTADYRARNAFRSTAFHNTPQVDREEINRFIRPDFLWYFHNDADFNVERFERTPDNDVFVGRHTGYTRLTDPVLVQRKITLCHSQDHLEIRDDFLGAGDHEVQVPLHLAPGIKAELGQGEGMLLAGKKTFRMTWSDRDWVVEQGSGRVSATYGVAEDIVRLVWKRTGALKPLVITLSGSS